jgi:pimeloyl-ACP methyl ester carboxylesterase
LEQNQGWAGRTVELIAQCAQALRKLLSLRKSLVRLAVIRSRLSVYFATAILSIAVPGLQAQKTHITNIVLVHGAWVDGSGWKPVYDILIKDGYTVTLVQEPLTSFAEDVAATRRVLAALNGRCILVGHSYGGSIITEAGTDAHVAALVYIAAHMPDAGENEAEEGKLHPSVVSKASVIVTTNDGFTYLDRSAFPMYFAADLPREQAVYEAQSQIMTSASVFKGVITTPAWRSKPSWMLVAADDKIIHPDLERFYAKRAHSHVAEAAGASHSVYESRPKQVAAMIEDAAQNAQK